MGLAVAPGSNSESSRWNSGRRAGRLALRSRAASAWSIICRAALPRRRSPRTPSSRVEGGRRRSLGRRALQLRHAHGGGDGRSVPSSGSAPGVEIAADSQPAQKLGAEGRILDACAKSAMPVMAATPTASRRNSAAAVGVRLGDRARRRRASRNSASAAVRWSLVQRGPVAAANSPARPPTTTEARADHASLVLHQQRRRGRRPVATTSSGGFTDGPRLGPPRAPRTGASGARHGRSPTAKRDPGDRRPGRR